MLPDGPRQPLRATLAGTPGDRRRNRLPAQSCAACGHDDTRVTLRTDWVVYFRCEGARRCGTCRSRVTRPTSAPRGLPSRMFPPLTPAWGRGLHGPVIGVAPARALPSASSMAMTWSGPAAAHLDHVAAVLSGPGRVRGVQSLRGMRFLRHGSRVGNGKTVRVNGQCVLDAGGDESAGAILAG